MSSWRRALGYGVVAWIVPFAIGMAAFDVRTHWRSLFESIMAVTLALTVTTLTMRYAVRAGTYSVREGVGLGVLWMAMSVILDVPLMLAPPIDMAVAEYLADIGLTYFMMPIITAAVAVARNR